jgi:hypothetical protein
MDKINKITIPRELLEMFNNTLRVESILQTKGIILVDLDKIKGLNPKVKNLAESKAIMSNFNIGVSYKGRTIENDLLKFGIEFNKPRIIAKHKPIGIWIPWNLLNSKATGSNNFKVFLTPKG